MTLVDVFRSSAARYPDLPALVVDGEIQTYAELQRASLRVAAQLSGEAGVRLHGVLGAASAAAFQGILGTLMSGAGYVPLNPAFPGSRSAYMLQASGVSVLTVDRFGVEKLDGLLAEAGRSLTLILLDAMDEEVRQWRASHPEHRFLGMQDLPDPPDNDPVDRMPATLHDSRVTVDGSDDIAYLMFTSGSTGKPKGVMISHRNILSYLDAMGALYDFGPDDRFSQMFDLTFDLSLFDMFVCWGAGAALYVVPQKDRMAPASFVRRNELTVWFSVPAVAGFMNQLKMLKPGNFPSLRVSAFCGEPLPATVTESWQAAAPNSVVDNLYGPTELTVACTVYRWDPETSTQYCENGVVPIGRPYSQLEAVLVDARLQRIAPGEAGELCVRGPQTSLGYWQNESLTNERFVRMPWMEGEDNRWYRTGDLVRTNGNGDFIFVGRVDNQVKILGYRVELGEIEARLREHGRTDFAIAVPWPVKNGSASGVVACLAGSEVPDDQVLLGCRRDLPDYMVPSRIFHFERMPLNANGKIDRNKLRELVEEMTGAAR